MTNPTKILTTTKINPTLMNKDDENVKHGWLKTKDSSVFFTNPEYKRPAEDQVEKLCRKLMSDIKSFSPSAKKIKRTTVDEGHLLVIDPADIHIGKLCSAMEVGEAYNNQIAVKRVLEGVKGIIDKVAVEVDQVLLIVGNDILHIDSPKRTTTSGTFQDTDGMWHDNFLIAKRLYTDIIRILMNIADVHVMYNPSNHDYVHGFFLAEVVQTYFRNSENVTFDCTIAHRKGYLYGENLIGSTHGDGAKEQHLPILLAQEFPAEWAQAKHRYIYTHHVHHKSSKDYPGVTVESLRSPSGTDSWHHRNGFEHAPKAVEGFVHSKKHGQIMRITHLF